MSIPAILGLALLVGLMFICCCGSVLYWYETLNSPEERIPSPRPGVFICLRHYCATLASYALCLALVIAGPVLRRPPGAKAGAARFKAGSGPEAGLSASALPPLILTHGIYNNAGAWLYLARVLDREGYTVSTYIYSSFFATPDAIVRGLDEHIAVVLARTRQKPVLIGHSLGGLLSRKWLADYNGGRRVSGIVTLGAPHGGSRMAVFGPGALLESIRPDGSLVTALRELPPTQDLPCVSLISPGDEAVLPAASLVPPQGWSMRLTPPLTHFSMLFSPRAAAILLEELRGIQASVKK